jgi:hypothetical protein
MWESHPLRKGILETLGPRKDSRPSVIFGLLLFVPHIAWGIEIPGGVAVEGQMVKWGQYRHLKGLISVEFPRGLDKGNPMDSFSERIRTYPTSGASSVLLRCQRPGTLFFSADGTSVEEAELADLKDQLESLNRFDMLPIVTLFDPDPSCRLRSMEAYTSAIQTFVDTFAEENWFLICVSEICDSTQWETPFPIAMMEVALAGANRLEDRDSEIVVGAGAVDPVSLGKLASSETLDVLFRHGGALEAEEGPAPTPGWKGPVLYLVEGSGVTDRSAYTMAERTGMPRLEDEFPNGFVVHFDDRPAGEELESLDEFLGTLSVQVDQFQKEITKATAPDEGDLHSLKPGEAEEGFVSLFNGKDFSGWVPITKPDDFVVKEGVIQLEGGEGGWLRSWNPYRDYVFRGEYWIVEGGNSGFYNRAPLAGRESRIGFEFQIAGEQPTDPTAEESTGAIYYVRPPDANFMKPDEWNEVEITCVGTRVKIVWNGIVAHDFKYEEIEFMKNRSRAGYIGLQDHHNPVKFRNLRIKELD